MDHHSRNLCQIVCAGSDFAILVCCPQCWTKTLFPNQKFLMMKKTIIATLVAGVILFFWQFLSWTLLGVHQSEFRYTPTQDSILEALTRYLPGEGTYMLPGVPPGTDFAGEQALMEAHEGKPWAQVTYHKAMSLSMSTQLVRSLIANLLAAWLLIWLIGKAGLNRLGDIVIAALAVGSIGYLTFPYLNSIWFETGTLAYLVDTVVQWGLVGLWLGWYLPAKL